MNDKIYLPRQDDTLRYRAIAQRTLAQETVCASIHVALLVSATQTDQSELQRQIRPLRQTSCRLENLIFEFGGNDESGLFQGIC